MKRWRQIAARRVNYANKFNEVHSKKKRNKSYRQTHNGVKIIFKVHVVTTRIRFWNCSEKAALLLGTIHDTRKHFFFTIFVTASAPCVFFNFYPLADFKEFQFLWPFLWLWMIEISHWLNAYLTYSNFIGTKKITILKIKMQLQK